ncbi:translesion error-prone DNA polymerase V subunit UmuC [Acerihabitans arboris]|uniref:Translesion error-prone DNA polymerase V subunit UmuC n=1 Tax=Acerihabitans arboris TaxID=2691583 RepID=A0A845SCB3_9GAMM|nr:translesion error-prone DNA polymerase V subunit UmuC [Acerihabitans arboris]NDL61549.1 translesion error-prone DNA polymerase V subunit UmuC [Acerihabitans arboris]
MYALVDINAFYASCETVFRPELRGRPVVVLSNNDGCVIARSAAARQLGIAMAAPYFKISRLLEQHGVTVFSSNYGLYADMSHRVMALLEEMAPAVEIYSIDEAFLDLTGVDHCMSLEQFGREVQLKVRQCAKLNSGVGIAPSKTLAKLANHAAKQWSKTGGVVDLSSPLRQRKLMALMPVEDVWGIGRRLGKTLRAMGIGTALQLADSHPAFIRKNFSVVLERTVRELRGEPCLEVEEMPAVKQQIICSRSFSARITRYQDMREAVCSYAVRAAEKLRVEKQFCRQISVFLRTSPHAAGEQHYANQATGRISIPTQDSRDIIAQAMQCLDRIWLEDRRYMKAGIVLGDFFDRGVAQLGLFDRYQPRVNAEALMATLDNVNRSGKGQIWFAGQGIRQDWKMKRDMLSPAYTTRVTDLPRAAL